MDRTAKGLWGRRPRCCRSEVREPRRIATNCSIGHSHSEAGTVNHPSEELLVLQFEDQRRVLSWCHVAGKTAGDVISVVLRNQGFS